MFGKRHRAEAHCTGHLSDLIRTVNYVHRYSKSFYLVQVFKTEITTSLLNLFTDMPKELNDITGRFVD